MSLNNNSLNAYYNNIENINYNSEFLCTYKSFTEEYYKTLCYQIQMLQALNINKYDEDIVSSYIEKIYYFLQNYYEINIILLALKEKYKSTSISFFIENNNSALFQLLFSYDYFDIFHKCLCQYLRDKKSEKELDTNKKYFNELKNLLIE
jgi:uncharacterized metal-binding protein